MLSEEEFPPPKHVDLVLFMCHHGLGIVPGVFEKDSEQCTLSFQACLPLLLVSGNVNQKQIATPFGLGHRCI